MNKRGIKIALLIALIIGMSSLMSLSNKDALVKTNQTIEEVESESYLIQDTDIDRAYEEVEVSCYMEDVEVMILLKLNEERSKNGLECLSYSDDMEHYARMKSKDMSDREYFSHENPEGERIIKQMDIDGVKCISWGENIAYSSEVVDSSMLVDQFITNWMNSPNNRANILSSNFSGVGVGVYRNGNDVYVTQQFYR